MSGSCAKAPQLLAWALALLLWPALSAAQTVEARLDRSRIGVGESTTLRVVVRGAATVRLPEFDMPEGLVVLGSSRQQSFAWVNGRASVENEFRYEVEAREIGHFSIGPVLVRVGNQAYRGGTLDLEVTAAPPAVSGTAGAPASLQVEIQPRDPYVGQEITLIVRLVQRSTFAEEPVYTPPTTTGFWTDRPTAPESFYADRNGERVLVTETRVRIYPLAVGDATIGEATVVVVVSPDDSDFPAWLGGQRRELVLRSNPVRVHVRALPAGAPAGYTGAVGNFDASWTADRARTSRDVPVTLRLDLRGRGNLPLVRPPSFSNPGVDGLANTTDDSLPPPGGGIGRKRFQWTVMPHQEGELAIAAPAFAWFDPNARAYVEARTRPITVDVGPPVFAGSGAEAGFPRMLSDRPVDPGARAPAPWAFAIAGLSLGVAWQLWRAGRARPATEAGASVWLARLKGATGATVWRALEESSMWLEAQPAFAEDPSWRSVRGRISAARYGGSTENAESVRREVIARITRVAPKPKAGVPLRGLAVLLVLLAVALGVFFGPRSGAGRGAQQCAAADQAARGGEVAKARKVWLELWRLYGGQPGLAARLAWSHVQAGEIGPGALWVMRGVWIEPRDASLRWVEERVREGGGLVGASAPRWPVRRIEWSVLALLLGLATGLLWSHRMRRALLAAATLAAAVAFPLQGWLAARAGQAVMLASAPLEGSDVELEPGQLVTIQGREGPRVRVAAGRVIGGWVPATSVAAIAGSEGVE